MSRHENEPLDFDVPQPVSSKIIYYTEGAMGSSEETGKSYAKTIVKNVGKKISHTHYVKFGRGKIYDPWGTYAGRGHSLDFEFKKVSKTVFKSYYNYLKTRNTRHLSHAERMIIDDSQK